MAAALSMIRARGFRPDGFKALAPGVMLMLIRI